MILLESIYKQIILEEKIKNSVALVPGSFKPPTAGHLDMVKKYSDMADKVIVMNNYRKIEELWSINK